MEKFHDRLLEIRNPDRSGDNAASHDAQTEAPPVGSYYESINAVGDPPCGLCYCGTEYSGFPQCRLGSVRSES
jgi:hypothetical protein